MKELKIKNILDNEYKKLNKSNHLANSNVLYNIISIKVKKELQSYHRSLYLDVKQFISEYILIIDDVDYGYDDINIEKIISAMKGLPVKQQRMLLCWVKRRFYLEGFESDDMKEKIDKVKAEIDKQECNWINIVLRFLSGSYFALILILCLFVLLLDTMLHPAFFPVLGIFDIELYHFNDNEEINYLANTLAYLWGDDSYSPSITPKNIMSILILGIGKLFIYIFIGNFIIRKLLEKINIEI